MLLLYRKIEDVVPINNRIVKIKKQIKNENLVYIRMSEKSID